MLVVELLLSMGVDMTNRVQIMDETFCISLCAKGKGMNPIIVPPIMDK